ncbi:MAG: FHA domain-containing protein [Eubacteriaceae bacterium]|nr:FHA domain-containing protein [Eubacteriaceae bacterium]
MEKQSTSCPQCGHENPLTQIRCSKCSSLITREAREASKGNSLPSYQKKKEQASSVQGSTAIKVHPSRAKKSNAAKSTKTAAYTPAGYQTAKSRLNKTAAAEAEEAQAKPIEPIAVLADDAAQPAKQQTAAESLAEKLSSLQAQTAMASEPAKQEAAASPTDDSEVLEAVFAEELEEDEGILVVDAIIIEPENKHLQPESLSKGGEEAQYSSPTVPINMDLFDEPVSVYKERAEVSAESDSDIESSAANAFELVSISGDFSISIDKPEIVLGRAASASVYLKDKLYVSRLHAKIRLVGNKVFIEDISNTNHTFVNNEFIKRGYMAELQDGDEIGLGGKIVNGSRQNDAAFFYFRSSDFIAI